MPYAKKPVLSYSLYTFYAIVMAVIYGLFTYYGIFARGFEGYAIRTYIWNLGLIALVLSIDRRYLAKLKKNAEKKRGASKKVKVVHFISFKASLYIFYMFALIASRLMLLSDFAETGMFYNFQSYLFSMEYGLILLVAADKFIDQFLKDKTHMKQIAEKSFTSKESE